MDLKIKDVAELLNVSETTIRRWLADPKNPDRFPSYLINHQHRFNREEVERWVLRRNQGEKPVEEAEVSLQPQKSGSLQFSLYRALHRGCVVDNVPGDTKAEVIRAAMEQVADSLHLSAEGVTELLLDRERLQPTALGHGIALPHTRDFLLNRTYDIMVVAYPKNPLDYEALDGIPVHTLLFLFASDDRRHLHLLSKIAYLASHTPALEMLKMHPDKGNLLEYIRNWESSLSKA
ncbi:MAG: PTS sugar transporter subunit IIA [Parachlamydiales bacterium]|jgi:PTS system nitrogen regulatory IIA component